MTNDGGDTPPEKSSPWNTLEVAKLVVSATTPIMIFAFGAFLSHQASTDARQREEASFKQAIEVSRLAKLIDKRMAAWDQVAPLASEVFRSEIGLGYGVRFAGSAGRSAAKSMHAPLVTKLGQADGLMKANAPYFSDALVQAWIEFAWEARSQPDTLAGGDRMQAMANQKALFRRYDRLIHAARADLALDPGSLTPGTGVTAGAGPGGTWWRPAAVTHVGR